MRFVSVPLLHKITTRLLAQTNALVVTPRILEVKPPDLGASALSSSNPSRKEWDRKHIPYDEGACFCCCC